MMLVPELDPVWAIAYWAVVSVALAVTVWALIVVVSDWRELRHADLDPAPRVRVARPRVDVATHAYAPLAAVPRLRPRDARLHDRVT
jgi:hypothetical protein